MPPVIVATCRKVGSSATRKFPGSRSAHLPALLPESLEAAAAQLLRRAHHRRRVGRAEPDRIHPHAARCGDLGRLDRCDAAGVRSVGQQDDDLRRVRTGCPWPALPGRTVGTPVRSARPGRRLSLAGATSGSIWEMASTDFRIAAPIVVPRPVVRESMALIRSSRSVVGSTASWAKPEKTTSPIRVSGVLAFDEVADGRLGRAQPVRFDIGRAHRPGDVEGQDQRRRRTPARPPSLGSRRSPGRGRPALRAPGRTARGGASPSGPAAPP